MSINMGRYTEWEIDFLKENKDMGVNQLAKELNRSPDGVRYKMHSLNLLTRRPTFWTKERREKLIKLSIEGKSSREIGKILGVNYQTVEARQGMYGLNETEHTRGLTNIELGYIAAFWNLTDLNLREDLGIGKRKLKRAREILGDERVRWKYKQSYYGEAI